MNKMRAIIMAFLAAGIAGVSSGRDFYVATNGASVPPYTTWPDASTNIEWAVNAATNSDTIWISNGVYVLTNQVTVVSNIAIRGFNANNRPVIDGNSNRCFNVTATSTLANLYFTRGYALGSGGGVFMNYGTVSNCVFSNNVCTNNGGGLYIGTGLVCRSSFIANRSANRGGGLCSAHDGMAVGGKLIVDDCLFYTNIALHPTASSYGGGLAYAILVTNCDIIGNVAGRAGGGAAFCTKVTHSMLASNICGIVGSDGEGGGGYFLSTSTNCHFLWNRGRKGGALCFGSMLNCVLSGNFGVYAGAIYSPGNGGVYDTTIDGNYSDNGPGGINHLQGTYFVRNCLLKNNTGIYAGGIFADFTVGKFYMSGCTIVSNYSSSSGAGGFRRGSGEAFIDNSIIYFNRSGGAWSAFSNYYVTGVSTSAFTNCCFSPALTSAVAVAMSVNNITNDPQLVDWQGGDCHLGGNSPCVNAGLNQPWMEGASDLDPGRKRIRYGTVDIGAYEKVHEATFYNFH